MALSKEQIKMLVNNASSALADYCIAAEIHNTVTGVSGGLDSAVTLALSTRASEIARGKGFELKSLGLILPCQSDPVDSVLAKKVIKHFKAELIEIDLTGAFEELERMILKPLAGQLTEYHRHGPEQRYRTSQGNVKARLRMTLGTYYVANMVNGLVLSTDNHSEYWLGFWTLHGDVGDFGMIQELWKGDELIQVAKQLGMPSEIIDAVPKDGLSIVPGGDEAQIGASYSVVDKVLKAAIAHGIDLNGSLNQLDNLPDLEGVEAPLVKKILIRSLKNSFKRKSPRNLSRKDLGII